MPRATWLTRVVVATVACLLVGATIGAAASTYYWGFPFARPSVPEFDAATRVLSLAAVRAATGQGGCTLIQDPNLGLDTMAPGAHDFPEVRGVMSLRARGLLTAATPSPDWLDAADLYAAVRAADVLVRPDPGYDDAGCFGGHVVEVGLPASETRVVVVGAGAAVSNDHHPYYEVVFRRSGARLSLERTRVAYFDVAGLEGFEWPRLHALFAAAAAAALGLALGVRAMLKWLSQ
ncbi:MAG TPA: hypothetical protein VMW48_14045 [Vicinamibacterales bacterium]|nr:hypothetical protein [Vicinamibacterales bacterium]